MQKHRLLSGALLAIVTIAALYCYDSQARPLRTALQDEYDAWLAGLGDELKLPKSGGGAKTEISVRVSSESPGSSIDWVYTTASKSYQPQKLLKLLGLVQRGNLFSKKRLTLRGSSSPALRLTVKTPLKSFEAGLRDSELQSSPAAQNFLKLLEVYAAESGAAAAPQKTKKGAK
jgi:hypothetical protein